MMRISTTTRTVEAQPSTLKRLLACGAIGPLLFIVVFLIEGVTRPNYNPWRHFVSSLSQGEWGWMQITNFIVCGGLVILFSVGLRRALAPGKGATWGPIWLALYGLCLIGAGIFVTDPMLGYPPNLPETTTTTGAMHMFLSLIVFIALSAACFVLARRFAADPAWRGWAIYSVVTGILVIGLFIATDVVTTLPNGPAGFVQRLTIITGWVWVALTALRLMRRNAPGN